MASGWSSFPESWPGLGNRLSKCVWTFLTITARISHLALPILALCGSPMAVCRNNLAPSSHSKPPLSEYIEEFFLSDAVRNQDKGELQFTFGVESRQDIGTNAVVRKVPPGGARPAWDFITRSSEVTSRSRFRLGWRLVSRSSLAERWNTNRRSSRRELSEERRSTPASLLTSKNGNLRCNTTWSLCTRFRAAGYPH